MAEHLGFRCRVQNVHVEELYPAAQPFAEVFSGLLQLKGVKYTMKLKPGAVGVVVPARRVPVALQDKVNEELQRTRRDSKATGALPGTRAQRGRPACGHSTCSRHSVNADTKKL